MFHERGREREKWHRKFSHLNSGKVYPQSLHQDVGDRKGEREREKRIGMEKHTSSAHSCGSCEGTIERKEMRDKNTLNKQQKMCVEQTVSERDPVNRGTGIRKNLTV